MRPPVLADIAAITPTTTYGENDSLGAMPILTVTTNLNNVDLGKASDEVQKAIKSLGELPGD